MLYQICLRACGEYYLFALLNRNPTTDDSTGAEVSAANTAKVEKLVAVATADPSSTVVGK